MNSPIVRAVLAQSNKQLDAKNRTITFVATKETRDRTGDIIRVAGWEFGNFQKNPVFLFNHDPSIPPIGRVLDIRVEGLEVLMDVQFASLEVNPFADTIFKLFEEGFMSAVSVGFIPKDVEGIFSDDGRFLGLEILRQELLELSAVAIPAHQDALAASAYAKEFDQNLMKVKKQSPRSRPLTVQLEEFSEQYKVEHEDLSGADTQSLSQEDEVKLQEQFDELKKSVEQQGEQIVSLSTENAELKSQVANLLTLKEAVELSKATMATLNKSIVGLAIGDSTGTPHVPAGSGSMPDLPAFDIKGLLDSLTQVSKRISEKSFQPKGDT